jgi:uncharacterized protein (TIGR03435 family)
MRARTITALAVAITTAGVFAHAQSTLPGTGAEFEAATIKRNASADNNSRLGFQPGGRFTMTNVPIRNLVAAAYGTPQPLPPFLVIGGPDWLDKDRYDVIAKAAGDPAPGPNGPPPIMFEMLRTLLAQRFKLVVHRETRDQPVYALTTARADGTPGRGLTKSTFDCSTLMAAERAGGPPPSPNAFCGLRVSPGRVQGGSASMSQFANSLARGVSRTVIDRTGLTGNYDFVLEFAADQMPQGSPAAGPAGAPAAPSDGASLFTALQEQLGLKLESTRAPVDVLVIDSIERPAEN